MLAEKLAGYPCVNFYNLTEDFGVDIGLVNRTSMLKRCNDAGVNRIIGVFGGRNG